MASVTLRTLLDEAWVVRALAGQGLVVTAVGRRARRFVELARFLQNTGVTAHRPAFAFFVPGRIEVVGKHTDYAGGSSLVCALERGFSMVAVAQEGSTVHLTHAAAGETVIYPLDAPLSPKPGHWSVYPMTVLRRLVHNFPGALQGGHLVFSSDLPQAAGMSSSSALVVGVFLALSALNDLPGHPVYRRYLTTREDLAHYLGTVENGQTFKGLAGERGVGTFGGSEDHTAILCARPGHLLAYAYRPTRLLASTPLPEGYVFALGASGVVAEKAGAALAAYNRAALLAEAVFNVWQATEGGAEAHLGAVTDAPAFSRDRMRQVLHEYPHATFSAAELHDRFEQFCDEHTRYLPKALDALQMGELAAFGRVVDCSQEAAERLLKNQIPETVFLARQARHLGAAAASAFGAGFGGSVWALVPAGKADGFLDAWRTRYLDAFPQHAPGASFFLSRPGPAAFQL